MGWLIAVLGMMGLTALIWLTRRRAFRRLFTGRHVEEKPEDKATAGGRFQKHLGQGRDPEASSGHLPAAPAATGSALGGSATGHEDANGQDPRGTAGVSIAGSRRGTQVTPSGELPVKAYDEDVVSAIERLFVYLNVPGPPEADYTTAPTSEYDGSTASDPAVLIPDFTIPALPRRRTLPGLFKQLPELGPAFELDAHAFFDRQIARSSNSDAHDALFTSLTPAWAHFMQCHRFDLADDFWDQVVELSVRWEGTRMRKLRGLSFPEAAVRARVPVATIQAAEAGRAINTGALLRLLQVYEPGEDLVKVMAGAFVVMRRRAGLRENQSRG